MKNDVLLYLVEASLYLTAFALVYRLSLSRLTHFRWMRFYLILSLAFSIGAPLLSVPTAWTAWLLHQESEWQTAPVSFLTSSAWLTSSATATNAAVDNNKNWTSLVTWLLLGIYGLGLTYKACTLGRKLRSIQRLIASYPKQRDGSYWIVSLPYDRPTFSFLHYVFLGTEVEHLTAEELRQVKAHEEVHAKQGHTIDRLFFEVAHCLFWFNPVMNYLKTQLQEVQEYLADQVVGGMVAQRKGYATLLLKLATKDQPVPLATGFSSKQITRRIKMLHQPRSPSQKKLVFVSVIPVIASLFLLSACLEEPTSHQDIYRTAIAIDSIPKEALSLGQITWKGNTVYDDETLSRALGLQSGDPYDSVAISRRLHYDPDGSDMSSLYMDQGYLFFNVTIMAQKVGTETVDLTLDVYEGQVMKMGQIFIRGNQEVPQTELLDLIQTKTGQLFDRSALIASQRAIAETGSFDPEQVGINPIPDLERGVVDIEFILKPRPTP